MSISRALLTIAAAAADSDVLDLEGVNFKQLIIAAPAALTGAVTVEISTTDAGSDWYTLHEDGIDVALAVSTATLIKSRAFERLRVHSAAAGPGFEAAQRDFVVLIED